MAGKKLKKLTPPDVERCQAEKPNGHSFMTLGGRPALERCDRKPTVIVTESKRMLDGFQGSMALCDGCLAVFRRQMPKDYATVRDITDTFPEGWRKVVPPTCDCCSKPAVYQHTKGGLRCEACPRPNK